MDSEEAEGGGAVSKTKKKKKEKQWHAAPLRGTVARTVPQARKAHAGLILPKDLMPKGIPLSKAKLLRESKYDLHTDGLTQGLLGTFLNCPERARLSLAGFRSIGTKESLVFGSMIHWLTELLARAIMRKLVKPSDGDDFFDHYIKVWIKKTRKEGDLEPQRIEFLAAQAKAIFAPYCLQWAKDDFHASAWIEVEGVFDVRWNGIRLRGRRDGVRCFNGKRGAIYRLHETKTKSQISAWLDDGLLLDFQNQFYLTALNTDLERLGIKKPIQEVMYNIIRRPGIKLLKNESPGAYAIRVRADVEKRPDHYYKRIRLRYTQADLKRFGKDLLRKVAVFKRWLKFPEDHYEQDQTQCTSRFACQYLQACIRRDTNDFTDDGRLFNELYE